METPTELFCMSQLLHSNGHVRIRIPIGEDDLEKVFAAEAALRELGISFDAGLGAGYRDWEFDPPSGAVVTVMVPQCLNCRKELPGGPTLVAIYPGGSERCFCSEECRSKYTEGTTVAHVTVNYMAVCDPGKVEPKSS